MSAPASFMYWAGIAGRRRLIAPIAEDDHDATCDLFGEGRHRLINRQPNRRIAARTGGYLQNADEVVLVGCERRRTQHHRVAGDVSETPDPRLVIRQQTDDEGHRGVADPDLVLVHGPAAIQHHDNGERRDLVAEERDGLFFAVVGDDEVVLRQIRNQPCRLVLYGRVDRDEVGR